MALPPGGVGNTSEGDKKRLMQRADSFAIGSGTRNKKDIDELEEFDKTMTSAIKEQKATEPEADEQRQKLEEHREEKAQLEAERRGSSSPSHQPLLGLSVLPGINAPGLAVGQSPESHSKRQPGGINSESDPVVESVSADILKGLKRAGLRKPLVTLDDPRLSGSSEGLKPDFVLSLRGNDRVYVWSQNLSHQIVSIGLHESRLESATGGTVETVVRRGKIDEKSSYTRVVPTEDFALDD